VEYTSGSATWGKALRRVVAALDPRRARRRSVWSLFTPVIALVAGVLFTTSATTAQGTALRDDRTPQLSSLIADRGRQVAREAVLRSRFAAAHPQVPTAVVPALAGDVHDLDGLRRVGVLLGGQDDDTSAQAG